MGDYITLRYWVYPSFILAAMGVNAIMFFTFHGLALLKKKLYDAEQPGDTDADDEDTHDYAQNVSGIPGFQCLTRKGNTND